MSFPTTNTKYDELLYHLNVKNYKWYTYKRAEHKIKLVIKSNDIIWCYITVQLSDIVHLWVDLNLTDETADVEE